MLNRSALIIGNSDGIGLALTKKLLELDWSVIGLSKSASAIADDKYRHLVVDVTADDYMSKLRSTLEDTPGLIVYCAGIGEEFNIETIAYEQKVFDVNLMGAVKTIELVLPLLVKKKSGHIIVLSSIADELVSEESPSYSASKAGLSSYVEGLALAMKKENVSITNVRFGFVESKMAKGEKLPMMMTVGKAVDHILYCIEKKPIRYSRPRLMAWVVLLLRWIARIKI